MSSTTTAAPSSTTETKPTPKAGQYEVGRPIGRCCVCSAELPAGTKIMAALRETPQGFERLDVSLDCWPQFERKDLLAFWQTVIPQHEAKKKLFVDDGVLCELFERLKDTTEPSKLNFRFVLGLILMRKRMLVYESSREEGGHDLWTVRFKGNEVRMDLLNPRLDEQQVTDVSQQLGQILNEEL
jgi:hypothetical protein